MRNSKVSNKRTWTIWVSDPSSSITTSVPNQVYDNDERRRAEEEMRQKTESKRKERQQSDDIEQLDLATIMQKGLVGKSSGTNASNATLKRHGRCTSEFVAQVSSP
jgi:hypothetical protein